MAAKGDRSLDLIHLLFLHAHSFVIRLGGFVSHKVPIKIEHIIFAVRYEDVESFKRYVEEFLRMSDNFRTDAKDIIELIDRQEMKLFLMEQEEHKSFWDHVLLSLAVKRTKSAATVQRMQLVLQIKASIVLISEVLESYLLGFDKIATHDWISRQTRMNGRGLILTLICMSREFARDIPSLVNSLWEYCHLHVAQHIELPGCVSISRNGPLSTLGLPTAISPGEYYIIMHACITVTI